MLSLQRQKGSGQILIPGDRIKIMMSRLNQAESVVFVVSVGLVF